MPNYDFSCKACHLRFSCYMPTEDFEKVKVTCPRCDSDDCVQEVNGKPVNETDPAVLKTLANGKDMVFETPKSINQHIK